MSNPQLHPFEINTKTGEPFLRLRDHKNIILTPPRIEDAPAYIPLLNDPRIYNWLSGPPFPYTMDHANFWVEKIKGETDRILKQLEDAKAEPELAIVNGSPVRSIREVNEDGTDTFIGDVDIIRCMHGELMGSDGGVDWEKKQMKEQENNNIPAGDPSIVWSFGDFLAPSHHGRGIMTDAVRTVLQDWGIPRMRIRHMWVTAFAENEGSVKVFLKNGFKLINMYEKHVNAKGKVHGLHLLEWKYEEKM